MATRYIVYDKDRKLAQTCRYESWVLKLGNPFSEPLSFRCQNH